jgi:hypothetical protein
LPPGDSTWNGGNVAFDPDGNAVAEHGNIDGPDRISKLDPSGALLWSREVSPSNWVPTREAEGRIATDSEGNVLHTYEVPSYINAATGGYRLAKLRSCTSRRPSSRDPRSMKNAIPS